MPPALQPSQTRLREPWLCTHHAQLALVTNNKQKRVPGYLCCTHSWMPYGCLWAASVDGKAVLSHSMEKWGAVCPSEGH